MRTSKFAAFFLATAYAQNSASWTDPSKHKIQFVPVDEGVHLEVLDWPGSGRPVVLLTGSGNTAHVYDDFAAKLADCCHVYAITRRGFGLSSHPQSGYDDQRMADDVLQVLDALRIPKPILIGHSMAGSELTTLAAQHPDRVSGLVYLDAGSDPADFPFSDPTYRAVVEKLSALPQSPQPSAESAARTKSLDVNRKKSYADYKAWQLAAAGFAFCEAEVRNMYDSRPDGSIGAYRTPQAVSAAIDAGTRKRDYSNIRVPVLSIFATPPSPADELKEHPRTDPQAQALVEENFTILMRFIHRYETTLKKAVPDARVIEFPGAKHYLFLTSEGQVLEQIHSFLETLP